jgi:hypothetical protein
MDKTKAVDPHPEEAIQNHASLKTLFTAIITGVVFWASLFGLLFFCLTS